MDVRLAATGGLGERFGSSAAGKGFLGRRFISGVLVTGRRGCRGWRSGLVLRSRLVGGWALISEERIVRLRKQLVEEGHDAGPRSIHGYLCWEGWDPVPSTSSIWRLLRDSGHISPQPKKRPKSALKRFVYDRPNECWQIDDTQWKLADGSVVRIIEIIDDHSRLCVASTAVTSVTTGIAWQVFVEAASKWGLPAMVLSDNGLAYNGSRRNKKVLFETNLRTLGINPVGFHTTKPDHLRESGTFPQTTKKWLDKQPLAANLEQLNHQLQQFTDYYNHQRPHWSLQNQTPAHIHQATPAARPANQPTTTQTG